MLVSVSRLCSGVLELIKILLPRNKLENFSQPPQQLNYLNSILWYSSCIGRDRPKIIFVNRILASPFGLCYRDGNVVQKRVEFVQVLLNTLDGSSLCKFNC